MSYGYAASKLSSARRLLMLPHPNGDIESIVNAFHEISLGLKDVDRSALDESAGRWVKILDKTMDTDGLDDPHKEGLWTVKARTLGVDELSEFSSSVDDLQCWFNLHSDFK